MLPTHLSLQRRGTKVGRWEAMMWSLSSTLGVLSEVMVFVCSALVEELRAFGLAKSMSCSLQSLEGVERESPFFYWPLLPSLGLFGMLLPPFV